MNNDLKSKQLRLIAEVFEENEVDFSYDSVDEADCLTVSCSTNVMSEQIETQVLFVCGHDYGIVQLYAPCSIKSVPLSKRALMLEACNSLNAQCMFVRFCLDDDGDISATFDFPQHCCNDCIGSVALEIFLLLCKVLELAYPLFLKTLYS